VRAVVARACLLQVAEPIRVRFDEYGFLAVGIHQVVRVAELLAIPRARLDAPMILIGNSLEDLLDDIVLTELRKRIAAIP
jgi:hypothetical protein